jgi:hypothetical protein
MKLNVTLNERRHHGDLFARPFPIIACNFQPPADAELGGGHRTNFPAPSFRNISRNYFRQEARHDFVMEALLFAGVVFTSAVALVISAVALIDFLRALGYF